MKKMKNRRIAIAFFLMGISVCGILFAKQMPQTNDISPFIYSEKIFDPLQVHTLDIIVDEETWQDMIENGVEEEYIPCDIQLNNEIIHSVGIRPKGNSSLVNVAINPETDRFSFKIKFDAYVNGQTYYGLNALMLNNSYNDKSYMKEYLTYDLYRVLGMNVPQTSYINLTLNGENLGLYLGVEPMEESFLLNNFGGLDGNLYKPEVGNMGDRFTGNMDLRNPIERNTNLSYIDENVESYAYIFDNLISGKINSRTEEEVLAFIKAINFNGEIEGSVDVDNVLKYAAVTTWAVSLDSYFRENLANNYYLYQEAGRFSIYPWDLNASFGGMGVATGDEAIHYPIDSVWNENFPLVCGVMELEGSYEKYQGYLESLNRYVAGGEYQNVLLDTHSLIQPYVEADTTSFFSYEDYMQAIPALIAFSEERAEAVQRQIDGDATRVSSTFQLDALAEERGERVGEEKQGKKRKGEKKIDTPKGRS